MNNTCFDCDVVRDLMPLVIDDAASGTSRGIVETHLKECPDCRKTMEELRTELAERKASPADKEFVRFVKNTGKKLHRKKMIAVLGTVIGLVGIVIGIYSYLNTHSRNIELTPENVVFALDEDGYLTAVHTIEGGYGYTGMGTGGVADSGILYFHMTCSMLPDHSGEKLTGTIRETMDWLYWNGESLCQVYEEPMYALQNNLPPESYTGYVEEPILELRVGTPEDYFVLYRAGDVLTPREVIEIHE